MPFYPKTPSFSNPVSQARRQLFVILADNFSGATMGRITLPGQNGEIRANAFFGVDTTEITKSYDYSNDGEISELEISHARQRLEEDINKHICGYGGPLGLGGWGGINEVCIQPWNSGGPARENTPDGYLQKIKVHLTEDYSVPTGFLFFRSPEKKEIDVEMTMRWEAGRVRLYQCTPPVYAPPLPEPPSPEIMKELRSAGESIANGVSNFFDGTKKVASSAAVSIKKFFS